MADAYEAAGVHIDAGNEAARRYAKLAENTAVPGLLGRIGGFAGGFALDLEKYPEPVLFSGTDGVGTKLKLAFLSNRHDTIGIDCVAMCVNDILTSGAKPLFFLDYLATGQLNVDVAEQVVAGVAEGCRQAGCALVGGETAEMPGMYAAGEYDIAGFAVGVATKSHIVDGNAIEAGDVLIGLESNGVHSNGYSLVRKLLSDHGVDGSTYIPGWRGTVYDELLRPTRIYVTSVLKICDEGLPVRGMAHITGGGLVENVPRSLPAGLTAQIQLGTWTLQPVFQWLLNAAGLSFEEGARIWNLGIGFVLVVRKGAEQDILQRLQELGETAYCIGQVVSGDSIQWTGSFETSDETSGTERK